MGTFTTFDHTADIGLAVRSDSVEDLLETAARAVFDQMLEDWPTEIEVIDEVLSRVVAGLEGDGGERLISWLQELLYRFEKDRLVPLTYKFDLVSAAEVRATVGFGRFDPAKHRSRHEIKAVTYHELDVHQEAGGEWVARFIVDV